jgi:hypothetical protein
MQGRKGNSFWAMAPPALLVAVTEVLDYFESKARPLKEDITVPSVFCKNKLLDNLAKEGGGGWRGRTVDGRTESGKLPKP